MQFTQPKQPRLCRKYQVLCTKHAKEPRFSPPLARRSSCKEENFARRQPVGFQTPLEGLLLPSKQEKKTPQKGGEGTVEVAFTKGQTSPTPVEDNYFPLFNPRVIFSQFNYGTVLTKVISKGSRPNRRDLG